MKKFKKAILNNHLSIALIIILLIPSILPLFHKGFFVTDDGEWAIIRFSAFYAALRDGQFPVRFLDRLNFGYGYPVANFLYPGFMYLGVIPYILKIGLVSTIKIILSMSLVGSALFTYFWLKKFFDKTSSLVGALFYAYAPYHLYDLYVRGSIGEMLALMTLPFILWQVERKSIFWISTGIMLLIISHNTLAVLFLALILGYMTLISFVAKKKSNFYFYLKSLFIGVGLAAFFWMPILFELNYTVFSSTKVSDWSNYFAPIDLIGYITYLVLFFTAFLFISKRELVKKHRRTVFLFIVGIISIFLSSSVSYSFWKVMPAGFIQFPFRFLSVSLLSAAFLAAFVVSQLKSAYRTIFVFLCAILLFTSAYKSIVTIKFFDKGDDFYSTNEATTTVKDEYMPVWVKEKSQKRADVKVENLNRKGRIENVFYNNKKVTFTIDLQENSVIQVNTIYWPGWNAFVDEKSIPISYNNPKGLMRINVPSGKHLVKLNFGETPLRLFSDLISLASLGILLVISLKRNHE